MHPATWLLSPFASEQLCAVEFVPGEFPVSPKPAPPSISVATHFMAILVVSQAEHSGLHHTHGKVSLPSSWLQLHDKPSSPLS